ncbi:hypothetical protein C5167_039651 [Papaver somniferum]|uniref:Uncharacterized protein n=1 Tax=Papaver somniferum TaxID=3469 RepID=A0A4Y7ICQ7_PAPSO|nr:hypothetical protein C5167_039651 [Papaver somniferum]
MALEKTQQFRTVRFTAYCTDRNPYQIGSKHILSDMVPPDKYTHKLKFLDHGGSTIQRPWSQWPGEIKDRGKNNKQLGDWMLDHPVILQFAP